MRHLWRSSFKFNLWFIFPQFDPLDEENMKVILAAEKNADDIEKRLTENIEEVQGIEKVENGISFDKDFDNQLSSN